MYHCELCNAEFLTSLELENHTQQSIERGKQMGGKFALLAKVLEGDEEAAEMLALLTKAGIIGPGFDNTPSIN